MENGTMKTDHPISYSQKGNTEYNESQWIRVNYFDSYYYVSSLLGKMN